MKLSAPEHEFYLHVEQRAHQTLFFINTFGTDYLPYRSIHMQCICELLLKWHFNAFILTMGVSFYFVKEFRKDSRNKC